MYEFNFCIFVFLYIMLTFCSLFLVYLIRFGESFEYIHHNITLMGSVRFYYIDFNFNFSFIFRSKFSAFHAKCFTSNICLKYNIEINGPYSILFHLFTFYLSKKVSVCNKFINAIFYGALWKTWSSRFFVTLLGLKRLNLSEFINNNTIWWFCYQKNKCLLPSAQNWTGAHSKKAFVLHKIVFRFVV